MGAKTSRLAWTTAPKASIAGAACSRPLLPVAFLELVDSIEYAELEDLQQLPEVISSNRVWSLLRERVVSVRPLCLTPDMAVLLLLLVDGTQLVIKGCSAKYAQAGEDQLAAELKIAAAFPAHPLMATALAACPDTAGGMCLVLPYAGVSFATIMGHPDWQGKLTQQERTDVFAELAAHTMTVHTVLQEQGDRGFLYRDTKPENTTFDPATGQVKVIDFGLAMRCDGFDYHPGYTPGRFTTEMVDPAGNFSSFRVPEYRLAALNTTTDVFLTGQEGLEMIQGLPQQLQPGPCDLNDRQATDAMLLAHHKANYPRQINRLRSSKARDFLLQAMAVNSRERLTPAAALRHKFLSGRAAAVEARVAETSPAYVEQVCHILDILAPLQHQPGVFLATHHHQQMVPALSAATPAATEVQPCSCTTQQADSCSSSSISLDVIATNSSSSSSSNNNSFSSSSGSGPAQLVDGLMVSNSCGSNGTTTSEPVEGPMTSTSSSTAADACTVPDAAGKHKQQLAGRLLKKLTLLKSISSKASSKKLFGDLKAAATASIAVAADLEASGADAVVVIEPIGVAVPGFCGMRWWGRSSRSRMGSKAVA